MKEFIVTCRDFSYNELFSDENKAWEKARELSKDTYGYVQIFYMSNGIDKAEYRIQQELTPELKNKMESL